MRRILICVLALCAALPALAANPFDGKSWWSIVKALSDDANQGRDTGSPGEQAAQRYLVERLQQHGVAPAGSDGYYQPFAMHTRALVESESGLALVRDGKEQPLILGEQAVIVPRAELAPLLDADLVFVGNGLNLPERDFSDYDGLDLHGKVAVYISGSPADLSATLSAHAQSRAARWAGLKAAGAIGMIGIQNPAAVEMPWSRTVLNRNHPSLDIDGTEFEETAGCLLIAIVSAGEAEPIFAGSGHTFKELAALAGARQPLPHFMLPSRVHAKCKLNKSTLTSRNVVAKIEGSDPSLRGTYVVLSAHLDHLGVGEPIHGDRIYNGAMDNASGSALLLELAEALAASPVKPKRSILFVWVTGEERGLLGSRYFSIHPTVPLASMIADINIDMFLPIIPLKTLTVYGLAESDLGERITSVATALGLAVQPDPEPLHNYFIRSDQYNFVRQGIPSLMFDVGAAPGSPEAAVLKDWLRTRYHAPSDDSNQPVDLAAAAGFEEVVERLVLAVADDPAAPRWKPDSFFRRFVVAAPAASPDVPRH